MFSAIFGSTINIIINGLNLALLVFGLIKLLQAFLYIRRNKKQLRKFTKGLNTLDELPTKEDIDAQIELDKLPQGSLIVKSISTLNQLSKTSLNDQDKIYYLEEITNDMNTAFPKAVPGMAVIIGFLGTVLGLLIAVYALPELIRQDFNTSDALEQLLSTMGVAFDGMGTAFGTTLVGLAVALTLTFGNLLYQIYWNKFEHQITDFFFLRLYPVFAKPAEDTVVRLLTEAIKQTYETMDAIRTGNEKLSYSIDSLAGNMEEYNQENQQLIRQVSTVVHEFVKSQEGSKETFKAIQQIAAQAQAGFERIQNLLDESTADRQGFMAFLQDSRNEIKERGILQHELYQKTNNVYMQKQEEIHKKLTGDLSTLTQSFLENIKDSNLQVSKQFKAEYDMKLRAFEKTADFVRTEVEKVFSKSQDAFTHQVKKANDAFSEKVERMDNLLHKFQKEILEDKKYDETKTKELIARLSALVQKNIEGNNFYIADLK